MVFWFRNCIAKSNAFVVHDVDIFLWNESSRISCVEYIDQIYLNLISLLVISYAQGGIRLAYVISALHTKFLYVLKRSKKKKLSLRNE